MMTAIENSIAFTNTKKGIVDLGEENEDAMSQDCYAVTPESSLARVAEHMAEHKIGSAVVMEEGKVIGLFTTTDALNMLAKSIRGKL